MFKSLSSHIPGAWVWLASLLFWLLLNTIAAFHQYRWGVYGGEDPDFWATWMRYLPWWGNWAFITPIVFTAASVVSERQKNVLRFLLSNISLMLLIFVAYWGLTVTEVALLTHGTVNSDILYQSISELLLSPLHMDFLVYLAVLGLGYGISYYKKSRQQLLDNELLARQLAEIELQSLKSQLNPHFLFNTLNTIASLIRLDNKQSAIKALSELSLMLRKVLENQTNQWISLEQELEFINSYLTIQKMRFESKLLTEVQVDRRCLGYEIPFMLLQPLVENAVQHGSQLESDQNLLKLSVNCGDGRVWVTLINKVPEHDEHKGFGIGLKNSRQRLKKLYGSDFSLELTELEDGYFKTFLSLPTGDEDD